MPKCQKSNTTLILSNFPTKSFHLWFEPKNLKDGTSVLWIVHDSHSHLPLNIVIRGNSFRQKFDLENFQGNLLFPFGFSRAYLHTKRFFLSLSMVSPHLGPDQWLERSLLALAKKPATPPSTIPAFMQINFEEETNPLRCEMVRL